MRKGENMNKEESPIFTIVVILIFSIILILGAWSGGWTTGRIHGHIQAKAYYETTGEFPSERWLQDEDNWKLLRKYQILDSLNEKN